MVALRIYRVAYRLHVYELSFLKFPLLKLQHNDTTAPSDLQMEDGSYFLLLSSASEPLTTVLSETNEERITIFHRCHLIYGGDEAKKLPQIVKLADPKVPQGGLVNNFCSATPFPHLFPILNTQPHSRKQKSRFPYINGYTGTHRYRDRSFQINSFTFPFFIFSSLGSTCFPHSEYSL